MIHDITAAKLLVALNVAAQPMADQQFTPHHLNNDCRLHPTIQTTAESEAADRNDPETLPKKRPKKRKPKRSIASLSKVSDEPALKPSPISPELADEIARAQYWNSFDAMFRPSSVEKEVTTQDLSALGEKLTELQFGFMNIHMAALRQADTPFDHSPMTTQALALYRGLPKSPEPESGIQVSMSHPLPLPHPGETGSEQSRSIVVTTPAEQSSPVSESGTQANETVTQDAARERPRYTEAFTKGDVEVLGASTEMRTVESISPQGLEEGWQITRAYHHWPTLTRTHAASAKKPISLVHENVVQDFERFLGIHQDPNLGMVKVVVDRGWEVDFSAVGSGPNTNQSAAEAPAFFDSNGNYTGRQSVGVSGEIMFPNALPGYRLIFVKLRDASNPGREVITGSVAVPIFPGVMSVVDLTSDRVQVRDVVGKIGMKNNSLTGESSSIVNATVRVIGQDNAVAKVAEDGTFRIPGVLAFDGYPYFIEVDAVEKMNGDVDEDGTAAAGTFVGRTHRHQVLPQEMGNVNLTRHSLERIQNWTDQLPKGISEGTAIAVVYVSKAKAAYPQSLLTPSIQSWFSSTPNSTDPNHYGPRTCNLGSDERVQVSQLVRSIDGSTREFAAPLQQDEKRFLGVEIPEGMFEAKLTDENGRVVWSMFAPASPEVVNVLRARR